MTQPAKVQEPSMEEILASIRRIIADDEAKPPAPEKPAAAAPEPAKTARAAPPVKPAAVPDLPAAKAPAPKAAPPPAPAAVPSNNQDDIDALLAGLDEATSPDEIRPAQPDAEVLELTDDMAVLAPPPPPPPLHMPSFQKVEPHDDIEFAEAAASRATLRPSFDPPAYDAPMAPPQPILSKSTVSAVESAFNTLAHTVLSNNARTLEDLVKEMLRPMLKSWLDDNLPGLVERIVKAEIERVSRGR
jgi:cell pole-organizing protein PopZ